MWALCCVRGGTYVNGGAVSQLQCSVCTGCGMQTASSEEGLRSWGRVTCIPRDTRVWPAPMLHARAPLSTSGRQLCGPVSHHRRGLFQDKVIKWGNPPLQSTQPGTPCPAPPGTAVYWAGCELTPLSTPSTHANLAARLATPAPSPTPVPPSPIDRV